MAVPLEPECLSERAGCLRALAGREGAQASQPAGGLVGTPISQTSLGGLAMERAALVVGASGRTIDLDREGDAFHEQFADALVANINNITSDSALAAAWRAPPTCARDEDLSTDNTQVSRAPRASFFSGSRVLSLGREFYVLACQSLETADI